MKNARSLLDSFLGTVKEAAGGADLRDIAGKAKGTWDEQSTLTKGAIAGGLLGVLLSGNARQLVGTAAKVGGAALIGGLAYRAYEDWKAGKSPTAEQGPIALPEPSGTAFLPDDEDAADDLSTRLLTAMVAAAKADGHVTAEERARIDARLGQLGLGEDVQALLAAELDAPLDVGRIAALATTPEEAVEVYAATLLVLNPDGAAEKGYLAMLAARLDLDAGLVAHLHAKAAALG